MRFSGAVGYASSEETAPGVFTEVITEKNYYGDVVRNTRRLEPASQQPPEVNNGITVENSFSILADEDAYTNFMDMRYVKWRGSAWKITNVEVRRPRLILTIGELWNGLTD